MVCISIKDEQNNETSNSKQYLLRVVYDSHDKNVHKLLEGIFGPNQMLDVKNGKIAKVNSTLTPKERDCFLNMISEALNKMEDSESDEENSNDIEDDDIENNSIEEDCDKENIVKEDSIKEEKIFEEKKESKNSKSSCQSSQKVSAEKLIEEFASFLNNIS